MPFAAQLCPVGQLPHHRLPPQPSGWGPHWTTHCLMGVQMEPPEHVVPSAEQSLPSGQVPQDWTPPQPSGKLPQTLPLQSDVSGTHGGVTNGVQVLASHV